MKHNLIFALAFVIAVGISHAQDTLVKWTFPTGTAQDSLPELYSTLNQNSFFSVNGGTSAIDWTKNGVSTKAAQTTQWDNGANTKYWFVKINATLFSNLKLSSAQQSGGTNAGPKYFKLQYKITESGSWVNVNNDTIKNSNDWLTSSLVNIELPEECNNQEELFVRWLSITDSSSNNTIVQSNGTSKIDNIIITGTSTVNIQDENLSSLIFNFYQDENTLTISMAENGLIQLFDLSGKKVFDNFSESAEFRINTSSFEKGVYFVVVTCNNKTETKKIILK